MAEQQMTCYLCGESEFLPRTGSVRDNPDLEILECYNCGLVRLSSLDHISEKFYANSEMHGDEAIEIRKWLMETDEDDQRRFEYIQALLPSSSLLDFGCGPGGFLQKVKEKLDTAHGVELESRLQAHFQNNELTVYPHLGDIPENYRKEGYNIITLFHVLEHLPDPKVLLSDLKKLLTKEGQIIVEVPNADDALLTLYQCKPFSHFTYWSCHLFLYNAENLKMLFDQVGLHVKYIKQIQRYSLANHLHWLSVGTPGGHRKWHFLDSKALNQSYESQLAGIGKCDTLIACLTNE